MSFEIINDIMMITTFALMAFMISLVVFRVQRNLIGTRKTWIALIVFCLLMVARTIGNFSGGWFQELQPVFGILAACIFPWALWKFYKETGAGLEEKG